MFREGLRAVLEREAGLTVVGEASDGRQALEMAGGELAPDVVILDIGLPGLNGVDAARQILAKHPAAKIIALSARTDPRSVADMLMAGARAYVVKDAASEEILSAVRAVHGGHQFLSPQIAGSIIDGFVGGNGIANAARSIPQLAGREREIVQLIAEGKSSKEMATILSISVKTVETHRRNITTKFEMHSIAELTKFAIREGLTSADEQ